MKDYNEMDSDDLAEGARDCLEQCENYLKELRKRKFTVEYTQNGEIFIGKSVPAHNITL